MPVTVTSELFTSRCLTSVSGVRCSEGKRIPDAAREDLSRKRLIRRPSGQLRSVVTPGLEDHLRVSPSDSAAAGLCGSTVHTLPKVQSVGAVQLACDVVDAKRSWSLATVRWSGKLLANNYPAIFAES